MVDSEIPSNHLRHGALQRGHEKLGEGQRIRSEKTTGQAVPRLPPCLWICEVLVELRGLEPLTQRLPEPQVVHKLSKDKKRRSAKRGKK